jgi:hypothetical protein
MWQMLMAASTATAVFCAEEEAAATLVSLAMELSLGA